MKTKLIFIPSTLLLLLTAIPPYSYGYEEMAFETYQPCSGNAAFCMTRIIARGYITDSTPEKFRQFLADEYGHSEKLSGLTVCFDSPGGSVMGGMNLGREIRVREIATCIADHYWSVRYESEEGKVVEGPWIENPMCASACSLAFLGGYGREAIGDGELLGVHQFRSDIGTELTAQVGMAVIGLYFDQMGITRRLLDIASITPPDEMTWLHKDDLVALGVIPSEHSIYDAEWSLEITSTGQIVVMIYQEEAWDREVTKRIALLAYIYHDAGRPTLLLSLFPLNRSPSTFERLRQAYIGTFRPTLEMEINDTAYEYKNVNWELDQDGAIRASIQLPEIFVTHPEHINSLHLYANLPEAFSDVRLDSYLMPSEHATYIRAALR